MKPTPKTVDLHAATSKAQNGLRPDLLLLHERIWHLSRSIILSSSVFGGVSLRSRLSASHASFSLLKLASESAGFRGLGFSGASGAAIHNQHLETVDHPMRV